MAVSAVLFSTAAATFLWMRFTDQNSESYERNNRIVMLTLAAVNLAAAVVIFTNFT